MIEDCPDVFPRERKLPGGFMPSDMCCVGYGMVLLLGTYRSGGGVMFDNFIAQCDSGGVLLSSLPAIRTFKEL